MRVLVTGASGFLGRAACTELIAAGHDVSALVRRPGSEPIGTAAVAGDLTNAGALGRAVAGAAPEAVVHLAAEIASQRSEEKLRAVNVEGTRALISACRDAGGPRIVFTSTVVTGDAGGRLLSEDETLPITTPYGRSKQDCERMLAASGLPHVVIRPSHVYGPGGWYAEELVARLRQPGRFCVIGKGTNLWRDAARAGNAAADPRAPGPPRRRLQRGRRGGPLGALEQREVASHRLGAAVPDGARRSARGSARAARRLGP